MKFNKKIELILLSIFTASGTTLSSWLFVIAPEINAFFLENFNTKDVIYDIIGWGNLGFAITCFPIGLLLTRYQKYQKYFLVGCFLSAFFGVFILICPNYEYVKLSRFILGFGIAILITTGFTFVRNNLSEEEIKQFIPLNSLLNYVIMITGLFFTYFVSKVYILLPFLIYLIFGIALFFVKSIKPTQIQEKSSSDLKNYKLNLIALSTTYSVIFCICIAMFFIFLNISSAEIFAKKDLFLFTMIDVLFSALVSILYKKIKFFKREYHNISINFIILGLTILGIFICSEINVYYIAILIAIYAICKTTILIQASIWYIMLSSKKNIGILSSIFSISMFMGFYMATIIDKNLIENVISKQILLGMTLIFIGMIIFLTSFFDRKRLY